MTGPTSFSVSNTVDRLMSKDRDFRYMALSDLLAELQKPDFVVDPDLQKRLCVLMLQVLQDSSTEVQGLAMKCLPNLVAKVTTQQAIDVVDKLAAYLIGSTKPPTRSSSDSHDGVWPKYFRDVAAMGLRSIVLQLPVASPHARETALHLMPLLISGLQNISDLQPETLELVSELLARQGPYLQRFHESLTNELIPLVSNSHSQHRKRVVQCLSMLASTCGEAQFRRVFDHITTMLQSKGDQHRRRTAVQAINAIGKTNAERLMPHLHEFVPILMVYATDNERADDIELREQCLQVFEFIVAKGGLAATPYLSDMIAVLTSSIAYDPNYALSSDDEEDENLDDLREPSHMERDLEDLNADTENDDDESQYSDDDDASWKIRRAAVRLASAMIATKLFMPEECYRKVGLTLLSRLTEREETVRLDVFTATGELMDFFGEFSPADWPDTAMAVDGTTASRQTDYRLDLSHRTGSVTRVLKTGLASRSVRVKAGALVLLTKLLKNVPETIAGRIWAVAPEIEKCLCDANTNVKSEALNLLRASIPCATHSVMAPVIVRLMPQILATTMDRYYKVTADALSLCASLAAEFGSKEENRASLSGVVADIFKSAHERLVAPDQDSEVKESAITCVGAVIAHYGDILEPFLPEASTLFLDRMNNEVTRIAAVRAVGTVGKSRFCRSLGVQSDRIAGLLSTFLRKHDRSLRQATLETLAVTSELIPHDQLGSLLKAVTSQIREDDMKIAALSVSLCSDLVLKRGEKILPEIEKSAYPTILEFISSPLLQGQALDAVQNFLRSLAIKQGHPLPTSRVVQDVLGTGSAKKVTLSKAGNRTVACCVAALCETENVDRDGVISDLTSDTVRVETEDFLKVFALTCLGELGRKSLLGEKFEDVRKAALTCLDSTSEDVKSQSALTLGSISAGNGSSGIPSLVDLVRDREDSRYLYLVALREAILVAAGDELNQHVQNILSVLVDVASSWGNGAAPVAATTVTVGVGSGNPGASANGAGTAGEESIRTATAECLGLICAANPSMVMPSIELACKSEHSGLRATAATAVKVAIGSKASENALESSLSSLLPTLLGLLEDSDIVVRRGVLGCVAAIARSRPTVLRPRVTELLPGIYAQTTKRKELVRVVDLGPFKYTEDDGLEIRKVAFECMNCILVAYRDTINLGDMVNALVPGLTDHNDVKTVAHLTLINIASSKDVGQIVPSLEGVLAGLKTTLTFKPKPNAVRQELERHEDAVRGALRAVRALDAIPTVSSQENFRQFMSSVVRDDRLRDKYESMISDTPTGSAIGSATVVGGGAMEL